MKALILFCFLIFSSCAHMSPHAAFGYQTINRHMKHMEKFANWQGESIGGSFYGGDVKLLTTSFMITEEQFTVEIARKLLCQGIHTFLDSINSNQDLIPHLNHYPFTYLDIQYGISLYTKENKWLGHAFLLNGNLCFFVVNEWGDTREIHSEPYIEALERVK